MSANREARQAALVFRYQQALRPGEGRVEGETLSEVTNDLHRFHADLPSTKISQMNRDELVRVIDVAPPSRHFRGAAARLLDRKGGRSAVANGGGWFLITPTYWPRVTVSWRAKARLCPVCQL
jgi:hypothetical protein